MRAKGATLEEKTPLIVSLECEDQSTDEESQQTSSGYATVEQTSLNIAKTCMGTGTLALPFAASQGGLLFSVVGLAFVSLWNLYSVDRLLKCADLIPTGDESTIKKKPPKHRRTHSAKRRFFQRMPSDRIEIEDEDVQEEELVLPPGTSTFGKVAWHAFGPYGLQALDCVMMILLLGVIIAYLDAIISFVKATPFTTGYSLLDLLCALMIIAPLSCVPDVGFLAKFSAMGLLAIFLTFAVILGYALKENGFSGFTEITWNGLWPQSVTGVSNWFGVTVFGYGAVPITYNIQQSMAQPHLMLTATKEALLLIFAMYAIFSDGVAILYSPEDHDFKGDVLQHLPIGWIPTVVRLTMVFMVMVTAPLIVIPCGELLEGKLGHGMKNKLVLRILIRTAICVFCTGVSVFVPDFVSVISFIGCCCVALASFVFPPLFYVKLAKNRKIYLCAFTPPESPYGVNGQHDFNEPIECERVELVFDIAMLVWGVSATIITTVLTFKSMITKSIE